MAKIKSLSVSRESEKIFEDFDKVRPSNVSLSSMIALAVKEYMQNHLTNDMKLEDFTDKTSLVPSLFSEITIWHDFINKTEGDRLTNLQRRIIQLENLISIRQGVLLR